jgi:hypothetical protein
MLSSTGSIQQKRCRLRRRAQMEEQLEFWPLEPPRSVRLPIWEDLPQETRMAVTDKLARLMIKEVALEKSTQTEEHPNEQ